MSRDFRKEDSFPLILWAIVAIKAFVPLLQSRRNIIESVTRETFQYGPTERQSVSTLFKSQI